LKPYVAFATPKVKIAPFKAPAVDLSKCEVDLKQMLYPKRLKFKKSATGAKKGQKTEKRVVSDAPALEAPASL